MNVTLILKPAVEKGLMARARARGVSLDDYLQELVAREAALPVPPEPRPIQMRFDNLSGLLRNSPFAGADLKTGVGYRTVLKQATRKGLKKAI